MVWRSVMISNPAQLRIEDRALIIAQDEGVARVMLEDLSVLVLDTHRASITSAALAALMDSQVSVITVDAKHIPNGVLTPFQSYSRPLRVLKAQLALTQPQQKRLWRQIIKCKIANQAAVLRRHVGQAEAEKISVLVQRVRSGDAGGVEARAAQVYFRSLFGKAFNRGNDCLINAALNYGYAIFRAVLARELSAHGFIPSLGLNHRSEQNAFNLADDLLEPYRPVMDDHVAASFIGEHERELTVPDKAKLISRLHEDIVLARSKEKAGIFSTLAAMQATVASLASIVMDGGECEELSLPEVDNDLESQMAGGPPF